MSYKYRDCILKQIGFDSYEEYLKSDLWKSIRLKVLERDLGKECLLCNKILKESDISIHHYDYDLYTLNGDLLDNLLSMCRKCHYSIEFYRGKKRDKKSANGVLASKLADKAKKSSRLNKRPHRQKTKFKKKKASYSSYKRIIKAKSR